MVSLSLDPSGAHVHNVKRTRARTRARRMVSLSLDPSGAQALAEERQRLEAEREALGSQVRGSKA